MENKSQTIKLKDSEGNTYKFREDNPYIIATNKIYVAEENPNIYIKVIKEPSLIEHPKEHKYIYDKIENELKIAKMLSNNFFPVPHVYLTKLDIGPEYITGYIVMDRIEGKTIKTEKELNEYFDKIMEVLNDLLRLGFLYKDINIDNFIIGDDNEVYLIDFEDVVPYEKDYSLIIENSDGSISLNNEYIKTALHESIHMKYIMKHTAGSNYKFSHKKSRFTKNRKNKPKNKPKNKSKNKRKKYKGCKTSKIYIKNL